MKERKTRVRVWTVMEEGHEDAGGERRRKMEEEMRQGWRGKKEDEGRYMWKDKKERNSKENRDESRDQTNE